MNYKEEVTNILSQLNYYIPNEFEKKLEGVKELYVYGAGFMGCKYIDLLVEDGYNVLGVYESLCKDNNAICRDIKIYEVCYNNKSVIISSFKYYKQMKNKLIQLGYTEDQIISPIGIFEKYYLPKYEQAFNNFDDELSKKIILDKIKYHILNPVMYPVSAYFDIEMFSDSEDDVFIDGGCFDGETAKEFAYIRNMKYKKIYCFEPTESSYNQAVENLKDLKNIEIVKKGLYSKETTLQFKDFGTDQWNAADDFYMDHKWNGPAMDYEVTNIDVTSLDSFFQDKPIEDYPTIIKLDIEGSEKEALLGMRNVIEKNHPTLIICAYHRMEDYYELSSLIKEICPQYSLKLRHYTNNVLESIIFSGFNK